MASPLIDFLGIGCALNDISDQHNANDEYGKGAIIAALGKRLDAYSRAIELIEDLVLAPNDEAQARATSRLVEWAEPWRVKA